MYIRNIKYLLSGKGHKNPQYLYMAFVKLLLAWIIIKHQVYKQLYLHLKNKTLSYLLFEVYILWKFYNYLTKFGSFQVLFFYHILTKAVQIQNCFTKSLYPVSHTNKKRENIHKEPNR